RDAGDLAVEPAQARVDLGRIRALVQAPLAAELELEVLDDFRAVKRGAVDADLVERLVEEPPGRPDERQALDILAIAGLLADQHDRSVIGARAEHGLRRWLPERTGSAAPRGAAERLDALGVRSRCALGDPGCHGL